MDVSIIYNSYFGGAPGSFDFPSGICNVANYNYVVLKQNHKIQKYDLIGGFQAEFGSAGSGNDNFFFPEDILTDGNFLYIVDSGNHRIKIHDLDGNYISEFGSRGTGNNQYEYPISITSDGTYLFIADKGNSRIQKVTLAGVFVAKYGTNGSGPDNFNFPEGITFFDGNKIAVVDSGNKRVVVRRTTDGVVLFNFGSFVYPSRIEVTNGILTLVDRQASKLYFYDFSGNEIANYSGILFFPESVLFVGEKLYVCDSANYRVVIFDFYVSLDTDYYFDKIMSLTRQLYPTGRAWWMKRLGIFDKFHGGLALSESRAYASAIGILNDILPDNDSFSTKAAADWEKALGLYGGMSMSLEDRKLAIKRKINHPGNVQGRQSKVYIQGELQKDGFDVYVYENRFGASNPHSVINPISAIYDDIFYDETVYDNNGGAYTLIANYIDESKDSSFAVPTSNLKQTFFIGGSIFGTQADVDLIRKNEFRELILKLKPAQMVGFLQINYI